MEKKISVDGMTCMHCQGRVRKYLDSNSLITNVVVDLENKEARFSCDDALNISDIVKDITDLGYPAQEK